MTSTLDSIGDLAGSLGCTAECLNNKQYYCGGAGGLLGALNPILSPVTDILNPVLKPVVDLLDGTLSPVLDVLDNTLDGVLKPVGDLLGDDGLLGGLTGDDGLLGGLTGDDGLLGGLTGDDGLLGGLTGDDGLLGGLLGGDDSKGSTGGDSSTGGGLLGGLLGGGGTTLRKRADTLGFTSLYKKNDDPLCYLPGALPCDDANYCEILQTPCDGLVACKAENTGLCPPTNQPNKTEGVIPCHYPDIVTVCDDGKLPCDFNGTHGIPCVTDEISCYLPGSEICLDCTIPGACAPLPIPVRQPIFFPFLYALLMYSALYLCTRFVVAECENLGNTNVESNNSSRNLCRAMTCELLELIIFGSELKHRKTMDTQGNMSRQSRSPSTLPNASKFKLFRLLPNASNRLTSSI
jgi:hypothetical protein